MNHQEKVEKSLNNIEELLSRIAVSNDIIEHMTQIIAREKEKDEN